MRRSPPPPPPSSLLSLSSLLVRALPLICRAIAPRSLQQWVISALAVYIIIGVLQLSRLFASLPSPRRAFLPGSDDNPSGVGAVYRPRTRPYNRLLFLDEDGHVDADASNIERPHDRGHDASFEPMHSQKFLPVPDDTDTASRHRTNDCKPMAAWQTASFPTCNMVHEVDMSAGGYGDEDAVELLALGGKRIAWRHRHHYRRSNSDDDTVIIKTLQWVKNFTVGAYVTNRRDAVAMERLTSSPRVISAYGFCGVAVINEYGWLGGADTYFGEKSTVFLNMTERLRFARDAALAIADVHAVHGDGERGNETALVHGDVRPWNFVVTYAPGWKFSGHNDLPRNFSSVNIVLKLHDFNAARFMEWNATGRFKCGFENGVCNIYRSPDECRNILQDEKIDVYGLGNVIFFFLTKSMPLKGALISTVEREELIRNGGSAIGASLPKMYAFSNDPAIIGMRFAMIACERFNPKERASSASVARILSNSHDIATNSARLNEFYELRNNLSMTP